MTKSPEPDISHLWGPPDPWSNGWRRWLPYVALTPLIALALALFGWTVWRLFNGL